ncbi:acetoacetate decarboxylase family protein [Streptomyces sp. YKOK-I1]
MPTVFGPLPGPRNVPSDVDPTDYVERTTVFTFTAEVRRHDLERFLPPSAILREAILKIDVVRLENLHWLAGRGYNIVAVSYPVSVPTATGVRLGDFVAVLWESRCEPILTGRDELGHPKLPADITVPAHDSQPTRATASWDGTPFFSAEWTDIRTAESGDGPPSAPPAPVFTHRYLPRVGSLEEADISYLTYDHRRPPEGHPVPQVRYRGVADGSFEFKPASWQQIPFQYPVINALAGIEPLAFRPVTVTVAEGLFPVAGGVPLDGPGLG